MSTIVQKRHPDKDTHILDVAAGTGVLGEVVKLIFYAALFFSVLFFPLHVGLSCFCSFLFTLLRPGGEKKKTYRSGPLDHLLMIYNKTLKESHH